MIYYKPSFSFRLLFVSTFFLLASLPAAGAGFGFGCFELRDALPAAGFELDTTPDVVSLTPPSTLFFNCHLTSSTERNLRSRS